MSLQRRALELCGMLTAALAVEPNPPSWPASVKVFSPDDNPADIQAAIDDSWTKNGGQVPIGEPTARYSPYRFAFMFKPGTYEVNAPMGYYVHVLGIGATPEEVIFEGSTGPHVPCNNQLPQPGQLVTFWRSAERFKRVGNMDWFVSQAAPLRDLYVTENLNFHKEGSHGSGGYLANSYVAGNINGGGQQQWFTRNVYIGGNWNGVSWNSVFVGCESGINEAHVMASSCGREGSGAQTVVVETAPLVAEKPYISVDPQDVTKFNLNVPKSRTNAKGNDWSQDDFVYPFEEVYVTSDVDTAAVINAKLAAGLHVVIAPGIYRLNEALKIVKNDQVLMCLGLSTLLATHGNAAIEVAAGLGGVRVAGCTLEAGVIESPALLQWGDKALGTATTKPSFMFDTFTRIGGPSFDGNKGNAAKAKISLQIDADDVISDHLWLWRGDHYLNDTTSTDGSVEDIIAVTALGELYNAHGLVVTGDRVRVYNLAVEHAVEEQVLWSGEDGEVYFFQCEIPYDVDLVWQDKEYVSYKVTDNVKKHSAWGVGTYSYFVDFPVFMKTGFSVPAHLEKDIHYPFVVKLSQSPKVADMGGSGILSTINGKGPGAGLKDEWHQVAFMCGWTAPEPEEPEQPPTPPSPLADLLPALLFGLLGTVVITVAAYFFTKPKQSLPGPQTEMTLNLT